MCGGHGELFVQEFEALTPTTPLLNLVPTEAAALISAQLVVGPGAAALTEARGSGEAVATWPRAADALNLPEKLRTLPPRPIYARAPDARAKEAA
jgi:hypothetical protein